MKNLIVKTYILCILSFQALFSYAQYQITGIVADAGSKEKLEFANVKLLTTDSVFVKGTTTKQDGNFMIAYLPQGNFILVASCMGYSDSYLNVSGLNANLDVETISIKPNAITLNTITVQASQITTKDDRQLIYPTTMQKKAANNGLILLRNLQLPGIDINPIKRTIESFQDGNVAIYLNGISGSIDEINALTPDEIIRIEYYDTPGMKYKGAAAVIDFITKQRISGGNVSAYLQNALSDAVVSYNALSTKYNYKKSEFGFISSWSRSKLFWTHENDDAFVFPDKIIARTETGDPAKYLDDKVNLAFIYSLRDADKYIFNIKLRNNFTDIPNNFMDRTGVIYYSDSNDPLFLSEHSTERINSPAIDIYYQQNLKNKQILIVNLVGTHINTRTSRSYMEKSEQQLLSNIYSQIEGKKNSVIAEGIYEKQYDKGKLTGGIKHFQSYTENKYAGNVTSVVDLDFAETYAYLEYRMNRKKFNYTFGLGGTRTFNQQKEESSVRYIFRPKIGITYTIAKNFNIKYEANIVNHSPALSDLNGIEQAIDSFQIKRGNPDLYTTPSYNNKITLFFSKGIWTTNLISGYNYANQPIMESVLFENDKFIKMAENQKNSHRFNVNLGLKIRPVNYITLSLSPGVWHYISNGKNYSHTYTNWHLNASLLANYKNWSFYTDVRTRRNILSGEEINYGERLHTTSIMYNANQWSLSLGMINPFTKEYSQYSRNLSTLTPSYTKVASNNLGQVALLNFSWNLNWGVKYDPGKKRIENDDMDTGIMSGKGEKKIGF
ncbi:MAG: carboxypeptidase-like regulatory domain-containing protein [Candidatus Symbiothrix sp.]|nr:carboxypeptidase-like regulatory domain-containing protein [Candidatus Symbiothrix sp.]